MKGQAGLILAKSQHPAGSLRLCITDIGSEISNQDFFLPKLSFRTASLLCKLCGAAVAAETPLVPTSVMPHRDSECGATEGG